MVAQVYKFIRVQELDIQKPGEFRPAVAQVLILLRPRCSTNVLVRINQQGAYHLTQRSIHKTHQFNNGDKVTHNGTTWVSTVDNNIWEPSVYGWEEVV